MRFLLQFTERFTDCFTVLKLPLAVVVLLQAVHSQSRNGEQIFPSNLLWNSNLIDVFVWLSGWPGCKLYGVCVWANGKRENAHDVGHKFGDGFADGG